MIDQTTPATSDLQPGSEPIMLHHRSALLVVTLLSSQTQVSPTRRAFSRTRDPQPPATTEQPVLSPTFSSPSTSSNASSVLFRLASRAADSADAAVLRPASPAT